VNFHTASNRIPSAYASWKLSCCHLRPFIVVSFTDDFLTKELTLHPSLSSEQIMKSKSARSSPEAPKLFGGQSSRRPSRNFCRTHCIPLKFAKEVG
jgi:hypothetical protein